MKKKLSLLFTSLLALTCLTGCNKEGDSNTHSSAKAKDGMVILCDHSLGNSRYVSFVRDTCTDNIYVIYFEKQGYGGGGSFSPYYNANGEIMKYEEFKVVHVH